MILPQAEQGCRRVKATTVFGGVSAVAQIKELRRRPDVVIGCPGRLLDLFERGELRLGEVQVLVLDEADHMFDMGFLPSIRRLLAILPPRRQNLLFSATMPQEIRQLTDRLLDRPHVVELSHSKPAETIEHALYPVQEDRKVALLDTLRPAGAVRRILRARSSAGPCTKLVKVA